MPRRLRGRRRPDRPARAGTHACAGAWALVCLAAFLAAAPARALPEDGQKFRDWTARCDSPEEGAPTRCYVFQALVLKENQQRLLNIAAGYPPGQDAPALILTLPLGISLPPGGKIAVDDGPALSFEVERCGPQGCIALMPLSATLRTSLQQGREARVSFYDGQRREISVPVSLLGFTAAFRSLQ